MPRRSFPPSRSPLDAGPVAAPSRARANASRWWPWLACVVVMAGLPLVFSSSFAITLMSQMGIMIVFCLSYHLLLGQCGMLSFGHAVYSGLGAYFAVHTMNAMTAGAPWLPVSLVPLVGGLAGAAFGALFGYVTTRRAGTTFAMITLGIGELVGALALMLPGFFGGEGGIATDRVIGPPRLGISFASNTEVYYLIAAWCLLSIIAIYAFTRTPLGRIANAVRDNPERAEFIGYDTQRVRLLVLIVSAFFAGISGGLAAINFELVSAENLSASRSGAVLLATVIGGSMFFAGPIVGAIVFVLFAVMLSDYTRAWQLYLGVFFVLVVMFVPGGLASLFVTQARLVKRRQTGLLWRTYVVSGASLAGLLLVTIVVVEMAYHRLLNDADDPVLRLAGLSFDTTSAVVWGASIGALLALAGAFRWTQQRFAAVAARRPHWGPR